MDGLSNMALISEVKDGFPGRPYCRLWIGKKADRTMPLPYIVVAVQDQIYMFDN